MKRFLSCSAWFFLVIATLSTLGCGSGRKLQTVSLSPASADAKNFANGQVSFTATGTFTKPPSPNPLTSMQVTWCAGPTAGQCPGNINPGATVDQNGVAQCLPGFVGTTNIMAGTVRPSSMNPDGGAQLKVFGSAQLTCP